MAGRELGFLACALADGAVLRDLVGAVLLAFAAGFLPFAEAAGVAVFVLADGVRLPPAAFAPAGRFMAAPRLPPPAASGLTLAPVGSEASSL